MRHIYNRNAVISGACMGGSLSTAAHLNAGVNLVSSVVPGLTILSSMSGAAAVCSTAATCYYDRYIVPRHGNPILTAGLPAALDRDVEDDRRLLRYVRGIHTGSIQSLHGGRLVTTRTNPRPFSRSTLEIIAGRVHPNSIETDNELIRQAASGGGKEDQ